MFNLALTKRTAKIFPPIRGSSGLIIKTDNLKNEPNIDDFVPIFGNSSSEINIGMDYITPLSTRTTKEKENCDLNIEELDNKQNISAEPKTINESNNPTHESSKKPLKAIKNPSSPKAKSSSKTKKDKKKITKKSSKARSKSPNNIESRSISVSSSATKETAASPTSTLSMPRPLEDPKGFGIIPIPADANSLYRCFSKYFHNEVNGHHSVRQKAVAFIRKNQKMFENIIPGNIQDFIDKHSITNTLPEEGNIISLVASHRTNLFIYDFNTKIMTKYASLINLDKEIYVMRGADSNYDLLVKSTGKINKDITVVTKIVDIKVKVKNDLSKTNDELDENYFINIKSKNSAKKITPLMNGFTVISNTEVIAPSIEPTKNNQPKKSSISTYQNNVPLQPIELSKQPKIIESCVTTNSNDDKNIQELPPIKSSAKEIISPENLPDNIIQHTNGLMGDPKSDPISSPIETIKNRRKSYKNYQPKKKPIPSFSHSKTSSHAARPIKKPVEVEEGAAASLCSANSTKDVPPINSPQKQLSLPKNKTLYPKNSFEMIKQDIKKLKSVNTNISTSSSTRSKINIKVTDVTIETQMSKLNIEQNNCIAENGSKTSQHNKSIDSVIDKKNLKSVNSPEEEAKNLSKKEQKKQKTNSISPPINPNEIKNSHNLISPPIEPENKNVSVSAKCPTVYSNGQRNYRKSTTYIYESREPRSAPRENQNYDHGSGRRNSYSSNNNNNMDSKNTYRNDYDENDFTYGAESSYYEPNDPSYPNQGDFFPNYYDYYGYEPVTFLPLNAPQVMFQYIPPMPQLGENPEDNNYNDWVPVPVMIPPRYESDESYFERMALYQPPNTGYFPLPKNEEFTNSTASEGRYNKLDESVNGTNQPNNIAN